ncbi:synaptonemal complex central element protein 1-like isoform X3 [Myxocyprinus asiaticus]|uniref:synaptonemal complex central element protein 1-like isoform X3 n=1 Tax=Myxocyprinus asiaticus TaxID=70543 RepID=UPI0022225805|nr:synaptonemal complex central element protein 1-like isoform X3 [Myxocyprinus asiaticus]
MSMIHESSFNMEDILKIPKSQVRRTEPKPDELFIELRKLQQAKKDLEDELMETMLLRSTRMEEEDALNAEALHLEGLLNEKEEINRSLQLTCEDFKQKAQRMKFQNQLLQLMEQHKSLSTVFTPQRLPAEIESAVYTTEQLLKAEQQKLEQLTKLLGRLSHTQTGEMQMDTSDKAS